MRGVYWSKYGIQEGDFSLAWRFGGVRGKFFFPWDIKHLVELLESIASVGVKEEGMRAFASVGRSWMIAA